MALSVIHPPIYMHRTDVCRWVCRNFANGMNTLWDWVFAVVYIACFIIVGMLTIGFRLLADKDSRYPFANKEMERFDPR
jgi:hypothetical protein